jgi:hypothetical protein
MMILSRECPPVQNYHWESTLLFVPMIKSTLLSNPSWLVAQSFGTLQWPLDFLYLVSSLKWVSQTARHRFHVNPIASSLAICVAVMRGFVSLSSRRLTQ